MLAHKKPFYRPRVGHWRDKLITQPQEEGSPLGLRWGLMEDREAEEERREKHPRQGHLPSNFKGIKKAGRKPGWADHLCGDHQCRPCSLPPR